MSTTEACPADRYHHHHHHGRSVPAEFTGRARDLIRRIGFADDVLVLEIDRALEPLRRRFRTHPVPRDESLTALIRAWQQVLPSLGRVSLMITPSKHGVEIIEHRAQRGLNWHQEWAPDIREPALVLVRISIVVAPAATLQRRVRTLASISLHALARAFQRMPDASDTRVITSFGPLGRADPASVADAQGRFAIAAPYGGTWVGELRRTTDDTVILAARTYARGDADTVPGP